MRGRGPNKVNFIWKKKERNYILQGLENIDKPYKSKDYEVKPTKSLITLKNYQRKGGHCR
jgi:hypothetical protein